jgi:hypothetical protein
MLTALRTLARDGWVVGIAAAAALAYAVVSLVETVVSLALSIIDGERAVYGFVPREVYDPPYTVVLNGHYVLLGVVVIASALALHATRNDGAQAE